MTLKTFEEVYKSLSKYESDFFMSIMLAQWALESDYGRSELATNANNYTGHKTTRTDPQAYWKNTKEQSGNLMITANEPFKRYTTPDDWAKAHAGWLTSTPERSAIYTKAGAIGAKTFEEQAEALTGTYATDKRYKDKLLNKIKEHNLTKYDKGEDKVSLKTKKQLVPLRAVNHAGRNNPVNGLTIHQTGNTSRGAGAQMHANYQANNTTRYASWHWQVDDKVAIQSFEHNISCYHASDGTTPGGGNMATIGIEGCINSDGNYNKSVENMAKLSAMLCEQYKLDPYKHIKRHHDYDKKYRKWCPAQIMNGKNGITWQKFLDMVAKEMKGTSSHNPQGLPTSEIPAYTSPEIPFDKLKAGQTVTIRSPFNWYDPSEQVFIKPSRDFSGTTDKIVEIKDIEDIGYSSLAYRLEKYNSWILEQDIIEARNSWTKVKDKPVENKPQDVPEQDDPTDKVNEETAKLPEGVFYLDGEMYMVEKK